MDSVAGFKKSREKVEKINMQEVEKFDFQQEKTKLNKLKERFKALKERLNAITEKANMPKPSAEVMQSMPKQSFKIRKKSEDKLPFQENREKALKIKSTKQSRPHVVESKDDEPLLSGGAEEKSGGQNKTQISDQERNFIDNMWKEFESDDESDDDHIPSLKIIPGTKKKTSQDLEEGEIPESSQDLKEDEIPKSPPALFQDDNHGDGNVRSADDSDFDDDIPLSNLIPGLTKKRMSLTTIWNEVGKVGELEEEKRKIKTGIRSIIRNINDKNEHIKTNTKKLKQITQRIEGIKRSFMNENYEKTINYLNLSHEQNIKNLRTMIHKKELVLQMEKRKLIEVQNDKQSIEQKKKDDTCNNKKLHELQNKLADKAIQKHETEGMSEKKGKKGRGTKKDKEIEKKISEMGVETNTKSNVEEI